MQYTEIFKVVKNENFQKKKIDIFPIFAQNINCGYTLEPPLACAYSILTYLMITPWLPELNCYTPQYVKYTEQILALSTVLQLIPERITPVVCHPYPICRTITFNYEMPFTTNHQISLGFSSLDEMTTAAKIIPFV